MASLTIDLDRLSDVEFALDQLTRIVSRLHSAGPAVSQAQPQPEALDAEVRDLLSTRTGQILVVPFVENFDDQPASFEDISGVLEAEDGVDPIRKVHSLIAGLGRWETPRGIKVFEPTAERPPRYRIAADILAAIKRIQAEEDAEGE
jgi:hypothetical protein